MTEVPSCSKKYHILKIFQIKKKKKKKNSGEGILEKIWLKGKEALCHNKAFCLEKFLFPYLKVT